MDNVSADATLLENCLESLELDKLAQESGWSAKSRKVTALNWCVAICMACTQKAPSLRVAAHFMGLVNALSVSKQALAKRLRNGGSKLLAAALEAAVATKAHRAGHELRGFRRVLVQDSTCVGLPKAMEKHYPGSRNQCASSAVMRIQAVYDLVGNRFVEFALGPFTRNDQAASSDILEFVEEGDLVLRDLGYLSLDSLEGIGKAEAFYLSRYAKSFNLFDPKTGERIALKDLVSARRTVEMDVLLGNRSKLPARLIAIPLSDEVADIRRRRARASRNRRMIPSKEHLELLGWQVMVTNCSKERLPARHACELYSMRWRIETIFKSWKSGLRIDSITTHTSKEMLDALIYAALLRVTLVHAVVIPWLEEREPTRKVSVCKLMDLIAMSASLVGGDAAANENLLENLSRHCRYDKRKRLNTLQRWDRLISEMEGLS